MKPSRLARFIPLVAMTIFLPCAAAQQGNQGSGSASGTGSTGSTGQTAPQTPIITPSVPQTAPETPEFRKIPPAISISGSVVQEDGTPPPFGTEIEVDCGNTVTRYATVNPDGHYAFQIGGVNVMPDASNSSIQDPLDTSATINSSISTMGPMKTSTRMPLSNRLMYCELRAHYPGYRSTSVRIGTGKTPPYSNVNTILMYRIEKIQGTSVSATNLLAPKNARKSLEKAVKALGKNKLDEAERLATSALLAYPKNAEAHLVLGEIYLLRQQSDKARASFEKAIEVDAMVVRPYVPLARLELSEQNWKVAAALSDRALGLDPISYPEAYLVNALAHYYLGNMDAAERSARKGQSLDLMHKYPMLHLLLANVLARRGDDPGSLEAMRQYIKVAPEAADASLVRARIQEKEKLAQSRQ